MAVEMTPSQRQFVDRFLFEDPQGEKPSRLRKEYRLDWLVTTGTEMDKLLRLAEWSYAHFYLFGRPTLQTENAFEILQGCAEGHYFYCAHYAIVFCAAATALGWVARPISVRRAEENYRLSNHNIVEVWSKERKKWLCFEPTYGGCVAIGGEPVSAYGWTKIDTQSFACYACLAWVPTNRLLGDHADKSIENWDHWQDIYVYFGADRGWKEDPCDLPPYYPAD